MPRISQSLPGQAGKDLGTILSVAGYAIESVLASTHERTNLQELTLCRRRRLGLLALALTSFAAAQLRLGDEAASAVFSKQVPNIAVLPCVYPVELSPLEIHE